MSPAGLVAAVALMAAAPKGGGLEVTYLSGTAELSAPGAKGWTELEKGASVPLGATVRTGEKSRLELVAKDGSVLRLAESSKLELTQATFGGKARKVGVRLWLGRMWAHVTKAVGGDSSFEVRTENAIAGVRGTSFAVLAQQDLSALVRVYAGTVGVRGAKGASRGARKEVPGPSRISRAQWEEVIAAAMTEVKVTALGDIRPAESFEDEGDALEWAQWNQARDTPH